MKILTAYLNRSQIITTVYLRDIFNTGWAGNSDGHQSKKNMQELYNFLATKNFLISVSDMVTRKTKHYNFCRTFLLCK